MVMFKTFEKIDEIMERAKQLGVRGDRLSLRMDLEAANASCPMDGEKLFTFPDFDFLHDVYGIQAHINRETGTLEDFFVPRCARK